MRLFWIYLDSKHVNVTGYYSIRENTDIIIEPVIQESAATDIITNLQMKEDYYLKVKLMTTGRKNSITLSGLYQLRELTWLINI